MLATAAAWSLASGLVFWLGALAMSRLSTTLRHAVAVALLVGTTGSALGGAVLAAAGSGMPAVALSCLMGGAVVRLLTRHEGHRPLLAWAVSHRVAEGAAASAATIAGPLAIAAYLGHSTVEGMTVATFAGPSRIQKMAWIGAGAAGPVLGVTSAQLVADGAGSDLAALLWCALAGSMSAAALPRVRHHWNAALSRAVDTQPAHLSMRTANAFDQKDA